MSEIKVNEKFFVVTMIVNYRNLTMTLCYISKIKLINYLQKAGIEILAINEDS